MEIALDAGADDITSEGELFEVYTTPAGLRRRAEGAQGGRHRARGVRGRQVRRQRRSASRARRRSRC